MSIRLARGWVTVMVVAALLAPEALLLHRCPCGRILDCCCRALAPHRGQSCHLAPGHLGPAKGHCAANSSQGLPASVQSWRQPVDRESTWEPRPFAVQLPAAGWAADPTGSAAEGPAFAPPVPPPRSV